MEGAPSDDLPGEGNQTAKSKVLRTEESAVVTSSGVSRDIRRCSDELERLGQRLDQLVMKGQQQQHERVAATSTSTPSPRKNSAGSHIPMPDTKQKTPSPAAAAHDKAVAAATAKGQKTSTGAIFRSTLKRMSRLAAPKDKANMQISEQEGDHGLVRDRRSVTLKKQQGTSPVSLSRVRSFREDGGYAATSQLGGVGNNRAMTNSFRRPKNKDSTTITAAMVSSVKDQLSRPATGGGTVDRCSINRSHSVHARRVRDRADVHVKKSRAVQTQLTRDVIVDDDNDDASTDQMPPTSIDFTLYMPGVLGSGGADDDHVETHAAEPLEPVDVRKNRQLTLDNMKLQREVERLKNQLIESSKERDALKKERRTLGNKMEEVQSRLTKEEKLRHKLEKQMDKRDEKMKEIAISMENVEREFENRDENIQALEKRIQEYRDIVGKLQGDVDSGQNVIADLRGQLDRAMDKQKVLLQQLEEVETEAKELQEFLQAEKMTLAETLKDCEGEIAELKAKVSGLEKENSGLEERGSHLVRLCEQRYQENLTMQAQLTGVQERAKDMLLAQGAEISRATVHVSELYSRLERLMAGADASSSVSPCSSLAGGDVNSRSGHNDLDTVSSMSSDVGILSESCGGDNGTIPSNSQFLVPTQTESSSVASESTHNGGGTRTAANDDEDNGFPCSESLQNLSKAISQRQKSENHDNSTASSSNGSLPSLVDRIHDVQTLVERLMKDKRGVNPPVEIKSNKVDSNEKENIVTSDTAKEDIVSEDLKSKENEINELKSRFLRHRQILMSNYQQAEIEIKRIDDIHHDSINRVLQALGAIPDVVKATPSLEALQEEFEALYNDSASGNSNKGLQKEVINAVLKSAADDTNANQSL